MAEIKDTFVPNIYGDGNEKEIKMDNGDTYIIRNTFVPNIYGEGYEQEIVKDNSSKYMGETTPGRIILALLILVLITIGGLGFISIIPNIVTALFG